MADKPIISYVNPNVRIKMVWVVLMVVLSSICGCQSSNRNNQAERKFTFAVLADIQYADKDTCGKRHYRTARQKLAECVDDLNKHNPAFVIQLGDLIDGYAHDPDKSKEDLDVILSVFNRLTMPGYHVIGNHCLTAGAQTLRQRFDITRFYYEFKVATLENWRFVVLDGNDAGYGVIGDEQLNWFRNTLDQAAKEGERVICFCHFALLPAAAAHHRMNKAKPILQVMDETNCVAAWFAGHDHAGGYAIRNGVHHVTVRGMVEAPVDNAYALIEIGPDKIREIGFGKEPNRNLPLLIHPPVDKIE